MNNMSFSFIRKGMKEDNHLFKTLSQNLCENTEKITKNCPDNDGLRRELNLDYSITIFQPLRSI
jgi:hemerythrin-like domain-containing protein